MDIYEKMSRWGEEKQAIDAYFWEKTYPIMDWESKLIWWRKDVFNAMNRYGASNIPSEWIAERIEKDSDFETIMKAIIVKLS